MVVGLEEATVGSAADAHRVMEAGLKNRAVRSSPKRWSHSDVPLYTLLVIIHTKCTGVRQNDSNV